MIYVCNLLEMPVHVEALAPSHLVSLLAPGELPPTPGSILADRHLRIEVHDICEALDGHVMPQAEHVVAVVEFMRAWPHDRGPGADPLLRRHQPLDGGGADRARGQGRRARAGGGRG